MSPWPSDPYALLLAPSFTTDVFDPDFVDAIVTLPAKFGARVIYWQVMSDLAESTLASHGFTVRDRLYVLNNITCSTPPDQRGEVRSGPSIRKAHATDLDDVLKVDALGFEPFWQLDAKGLGDAVLATARARFRVATLPGISGRHTILGYAIFGQSRQRGYLQRIAVDPEYRGRGVATALIEDGLAWLRRWRTEQVTVNTQHANDVAFRLYRNLGFVEDARGITVMQSPPIL